MNEELEFQRWCATENIVFPVNGKLPPGIYTLVHNRYRQYSSPYVFKYINNKYDVPKKLYGKTQERVNRVWNEFVIKGKSVGVIYTGVKGSGKTLEATVLGNLAIDNGLPVIQFTGTDYLSSAIIATLDTMKDVVVFLDEFGKNTGDMNQMSALTMFNDIMGNKKIFIVTENSTLKLNTFLLDRPGRFRYHHSFIKVPFDVYEDFLNDSVVLEDFKRDLDNLYKMTDVFSFDQLHAIVTEHEHYPDDTLDECLRKLNLHGLQPQYQLVVSSIQDMKTNKFLNGTLVSPGKGKVLLEDLELRRWKGYINALEDNNKLKFIYPIALEDLVVNDNNTYVINMVYNNVPYKIVIDKMPHVDEVDTDITKGKPVIDPGDFQYYMTS